MKKLIIILSVASLLILSCCKTKPVCRSVADSQTHRQQTVSID